MCIIIDANCLKAVFFEDNSDHLRFEPVYKFIRKNGGKIVFGGSTYNTELKKVGSCRSLLVNLAKIKQVHRVSDTEVDQLEEKLKLIEPAREFDDAHLLAIVIVSGCRLICAYDKQCSKYLLKKDIYGKAKNRPKFYRNEKDAIYIQPQVLRTICRICNDR